jgi:hypothetical protein
MAQKRRARPSKSVPALRLTELELIVHCLTNRVLAIPSHSIALRKSFCGTRDPDFETGHGIHDLRAILPSARRAEERTTTRNCRDSFFAYRTVTILPYNTSIMPDPKFVFMSVSERAHALGVTGGRIRQLLLAGEISGHQLGERCWAILPSEIERYKKRRRGPGRPRQRKP